MTPTIINNRHSVFKIELGDDYIHPTAKQTNVLKRFYPGSKYYNLILDAIEWDTVNEMDNIIIEAWINEVE